LKAAEERFEAVEKRARKAKAAAESARQSAELFESARRHNSTLPQQYMDKMTWLEAKVEKLKTQDIEQQEEIFSTRRRLNDAECNASQLTSRVDVLESEVTRAIEDLSRETARRDAADNRVNALRTVAASIADAVLGASSSAADPFERLRQVPDHLRAQQREIASTGIFFWAR
jgi:chromosome segregation ATPase